eukprot:456093-Rhodomonas_salina.1
MGSAGTGSETRLACGEQSQQGGAETVPLTRPASGRTDNTQMTREKAVAQRVPHGKEGTRAEDEREMGARTRLRSETTARNGRDEGVSEAEPGAGEKETDTQMLGSGEEDFRTALRKEAEDATSAGRYLWVPKND